MILSQSHIEDDAATAIKAELDLTDANVNFIQGSNVSELSIDTAGLFPQIWIGCNLTIIPTSGYGSSLIGRVTYRINIYSIVKGDGEGNAAIADARDKKDAQTIGILAAMGSSLDPADCAIPYTNIQVNEVRQVESVFVTHIQYAAEAEQQVA